MATNQIDLQTGIWNASPYDPDAPAILFCADWAPVRSLREPILERPGSLYGPGVREELATAALRVVNVETTLLADPDAFSPVPKEGPAFGSPAEAVQDLREAGFDLALLANNHSSDFGPEGLTETRRVLEEAGLMVCGVGNTQEDAYRGRTFQLGSTPVAIVNFQEGEEGPCTNRNPGLAGWDLERACAEIERLRKAGRRVIAVPHADKEFLPVPAPYAQTAYRRLVDAGACAVISHHPHVPRGWESYKGAPILYSQGNFLFWSGQPGLFRRLGYMVRFHFTENGTCAFRLIPYHIRPGGLELLDERQRHWFLSQLEKVSGEALAPASTRAFWNAAIDAIPRKAWLRDATGMEFTFRKMQEGDPLGIARLRTRLVSPSHFHFMVDGISRVLEGSHGTSPAELMDILSIWDQPSEAFPLTAADDSPENR